MPTRSQLADALGKVPGVEVLNETFFNEFTIRVPGDGRAGDRAAGRARACSAACRCSRLCAGQPDLRDLIIVASTEVNTDEDRAAYVAALKEVLAVRRPSP